MASPVSVTDKMQGKLTIKLETNMMTLVGLGSAALILSEVLQILNKQEVPECRQ